MDPRLAPLWAILDLNTGLVHNCLDGLSGEETRTRAGDANSIAFLLAHLVDTRHFLAGYLGAPIGNPLGAVLADARAIADVPVLPALDELARMWSDIGEHLVRVGPQIAAAALDEPGLQRFPGTDGTRLQGAAFLVQHDSYHLGQIAMLRRQLGHPPMRYARRTTQERDPPTG